jgi:glycerol-3-phosphate acyltransferase PlsX
MGGDYGPPVTIPAAVLAVQQCPNLHLILCGDQTQIDAQLRKARFTPTDQLEIIHCSQVVTMDEKPASTLRKKPDSSMRRALELVETGEADACVSAGNTGALLINAYYVLKILAGIN